MPAGGGHQLTVGQPAELPEYQLQLAELDRLAELYAEADRGRRTASGEADAGPMSLAEQAQVKPAPAPEPEPESSEAVPIDPVGPVPDSCDEYSGNRATGCALALDAGLSLDQMSCLDSLWTKESGWNHQAQNPSSGAYGIPQALPGDKMASHGGDWRTNPATQIRWGLDYISNRYGSPCGAWSFWQANNWY